MLLCENLLILGLPSLRLRADGKKTVRAFTGGTVIPVQADAFFEEVLRWKIQPIGPNLSLAGC
jgi:hypothetical protein